MFGLLKYHLLEEQIISVIIKLCKSNPIRKDSLFHFILQKTSYSKLAYITLSYIYIQKHSPLSNIAKDVFD